MQDILNFSHIITGILLFFNYSYPSEWHVTVIMICISLMANNVEHNFVFTGHLSLEPIFKNWFSVDHPSLKKEKSYLTSQGLYRRQNLAQSVLNISLLVEWHSTQLKEETLPSKYLVSLRASPQPADGSAKPQDTSPL